MRLFNLHGDGAAEIVRAVGLISSSVSFDKWEPLLPLGIRDVSAVIGRGPVAALARYYESGSFPSGDMPDDAGELLFLLQQAVALFTWLKIIPTLDAQHDGTGRSRRLGENEKGLTALQEFKDERNIRLLAYEAVDALIERLEDSEPDFWTASPLRRMRSGLLLRSKEEFDRYYLIGSHRLYYTLLPMVREVQDAFLAPVLGRWLPVLLSGSDPDVSALLGENAARATALLAMKKAVERLPVEVIPEGVVQVNQSQPVSSRLRAEQSARQAVAASLGADADRILSALEAAVAALEEPDSPDSSGIPGPIVHSKGMSF